MSNVFTIVSALLATAMLAGTVPETDEVQLQKAREAIKGMAGCYLVDYNYTEVESLKPGYIRDSRIYDPNKRRSVKEWIYADEISPRHVRLQHILFATELSGDLVPKSIIKHQAEDWEYDAAFLYEFTGPRTWMVKDLKDLPAVWTRRITNLDDGLRYQCAAEWNLWSEYPEWSCINYAPIPGRETRDMSRDDYNALERSTRIVVYPESWLERQENIKTIDENGVRTPLAREIGKNWYIRLPESECDSAQAFVDPRRSFWNLLRETWETVLIGDRPFIEKDITAKPPRFAKIFEIQEQYASQDLTNPEIRQAAKDAILTVITDYRAN